jgi:hypothetical protein
MELSCCIGIEQIGNSVKIKISIKKTAYQRSAIEISVISSHAVGVEKWTHIVAVRPNVILGREYLFSLRIEASVFFFWKTMPYYNKKYRFSTALKLCLKEIFTKRKTVRVISSRDSRRSARNADRRVVKQEMSGIPVQRAVADPSFTPDGAAHACSCRCELK